MAAPLSLRVRSSCPKVRLGKEETKITAFEQVVWKLLENESSMECHFTEQDLAYVFSGRRFLTVSSKSAAAGSSVTAVLGGAQGQKHGRDRVHRTPEHSGGMGHELTPAPEGRAGKKEAAAALKATARR